MYNTHSDLNASSELEIVLKYLNKSLTSQYINKVYLTHVKQTTLLVPQHPTFPSVKINFEWLRANLFNQTFSIFNQTFRKVCHHFPIIPFCVAFSFLLPLLLCIFHCSRHAILS